MNEATITTSNGHEIQGSVEKLTAQGFKNLLADEFGINGESPAKRVEQLRLLSNQGIAILWSTINHLAQGSAESLFSGEVVKIGGKETIPEENRYDVFTHLIDSIKNTPPLTNPARIGDAMALGLVLLHPFHDGNGRTARLIGLAFHSPDFDDPDEYEKTFAVLAEARDDARKRGGWMVNGYIPHFPEGFDQSDPQQVAGYLSSLLTDEATPYTGPFGTASLQQQA